MLFKIINEHDDRVHKVGYNHDTNDVGLFQHHNKGCTLLQIQEIRPLIVDKKFAG